MSKEMGIILLGVAVVVVPYLGVPSAWRTLLLVLAGITLIVIGFLLRAQGTAGQEKRSPYHPFVENLPTGQVGSAATAAPIDEPSLTPLHEHKEGITSLN